MECIVRRAGESDAEILSLLNADVQSLHAAAMPTRFKKVESSTFSPEAARSLLADPKRFIFLAIVESEAVGYAYAQVIHQPESPFTYAWDEVHLHHISVRPAFRRSGVATALLDAVHGAASESQIDLMTLQTWTFNEDAQTFFRRNGFTPYLIRLWNGEMK
jgi:ribosomal protein S18 acetylase RimI-like enzyme